jgi:hypothetical protein
MLHSASRTTAIAAGLYAARRFSHDWGSTKEECRAKLPGDELVRRPRIQTTEAVWIDASAAEIWAVLMQLGQKRGGLYGSATLGCLFGFGVRDSLRIGPERCRLAVGDVVHLAPKGWMGLRAGVALPVAGVTAERSVVLRVAPSGWRSEAVWSIHIIPHWSGRCRLLVRTRAQLRHPGEVFAVELAGPVAALLTRGMLLGVRRRVAAGLCGERGRDSRVASAEHVGAEGDRASAGHSAGAEIVRTSTS